MITLSRSLVEPFITYSERRDLREKAWRLWTSRGELDAGRDNLQVAKRILELRLVWLFIAECEVCALMKYCIVRQEQASMHGYATYAEYATADTMAGSPARVLELLEVHANRLV